MSQNILLLIRADIQAVSQKVDVLQSSVDDVRANLPDVTELNEKLDAQSASLATLQTAVDAITDILNPEIPEIPEVPDVPDVPLRKKKSSPK
uniref:p10 n=1 Tax=Chrysodeixis includens nucleopolyhedrovirus TaxID=1207438 RepID=A0A1C8ZZB2_9ABAC|nr:P10 [Chrysodeixis includens nucleopolyhedrovirus]AOL56597.1 P10 [Chrysodeixis includens nucleopolyhedrovirus]AOL56880.1 P10 [Chrysodeixis includens nucleopolyhedrovirus]AOL57022.1 P10 [Chrysodeixis includens nucleopolyhedrovirus]AOL57163.1 P10 [Chrysodeixis includens nucleopolyhedrovirus]